MTKKINVYGRNGEVEQHTRANGRDMVANPNGYWSWNPQRSATGPMAAPPFITLKPPSNKPQSQEILERMGTGVIRDVEEVTALDPEADVTDPDEEGEAGVVTVEDTNPSATDAATTPAAPSAPEPISEPVKSKPNVRRKRFEE